MEERDGERGWLVCRELGFACLLPSATSATACLSLSGVDAFVCLSVGEHVCRPVCLSALLTVVRDGGMSCRWID